MTASIFDISPLIESSLAVWPGDQAFQRQVALDFKQGDNLVLSNITTTLHLGAHADAPSHYHPKGRSIEHCSLETYIGPAQVVRIEGLKRGHRINLEHVKGLDIQAPRLIFATDSYPNPQSFNEDFCSLSPELIRYLAGLGVILIGIDTPSVDPFSSKALEAHNEVYKHRLAILEGLVLTDVPEGVYELIALPLKIKGADASPVRAILRKGPPRGDL